MQNDNREAFQQDAAPQTLSYRALLEKTIHDEWGPVGSIENMSPSSSPFSSEKYTLEKQWRKQREQIPNTSQFLCTGGVQPHVAFERELNTSLRFMASFLTNPKQFSDQDLESARDAMIALKGQADDVNIRGGWGFNPAAKNKIISQNNEALAEQKKAEAKYSESDESGLSVPSFK